jgi:outer membrane protein assembly factor BamC
MQRGHHPTWSASIVSVLPLRAVVGCALSVLALQLAGCSSVGEVFAGDRIDYRSSAKRTDTLEVPPDLSQLSREGRFAPQSQGVVSASSYAAQPPSGTSTGAAAVALQALGDLRVERAGTQRWLVTNLKPEDLWPKLQEFWQANGFAIAVNAPESGVMETDWAENRAKLPMDVIRRTLGRVLNTLYSTGELDKFRTRLERTPAGTEVYISHRGMEEVYTGREKDETRWQPRAVDPQLEAEMLSRLMAHLGRKAEESQAAVAAAPQAPVRARLMAAQGATAVQVDEGFDRAWRRVGLALDRGGFTVEDRDRSGGIYFVRYIDPARDVGDKPGLLSRLFGGGAREAPAPGADRWRVAVKADGERSLVSVLDAQGAPASGATAQRIAALLVDELK